MQKQSHIIDTKVAKLRDYNTTIWVLGPLTSSTRPPPGPARWTPVSVGPVVLVELRVVVRVAVLDGDAPGQDGGHVVAHRLALGLLLPLLLHLLQLDPYRPETQLRTQSLCPLRLNRDGPTSLLDLFWLTDARMKCF